MCSHMCALIYVLLYVCSHMCALIYVLSSVCSYMCAFFCVLSSVCSPVCALVCVLSSVCALLSDFLCVLSYVCSDMSALMCSHMSAPLCSHLCVFVIIITTTSLVSFCPPPHCLGSLEGLITTHRSSATRTVRGRRSFSCRCFTHRYLHPQTPLHAEILTEMFLFRSLDNRMFVTPRSLYTHARLCT